MISNNNLSEAPSKEELDQVDAFFTNLENVTTLTDEEQRIIAFATIDFLTTPIANHDLQPSDLKIIKLIVSDQKRWPPLREWLVRLGTTDDFSADAKLERAEAFLGSF